MATHDASTVGAGAAAIGVPSARLPGLRQGGAVGVLGRVFGAPDSWSITTLACAVGAAACVAVTGLPALADDGAPVEDSAVGMEREAEVSDVVPEGEPVEVGDETWLTAPDAVTASVIARLEGAPVEVVGERTETGSVFALPDGSSASSSYSGPVWVRRGGDGTQVEDWAELDVTLRADSDGQVRAVAHPGDLVISGGTPEDWPEDARVAVASMTTPEGDVAIEWVGPLPVPRLEGARAVFEQVRPGMDMVVDAKPMGVEQYFVLHEAPEEPLSLPIVLSAEATTLVESADGSWEAVTAEGDVISRVPEPQMWDAVADVDRVHPITEPWRDLGVEIARTPPDSFLEPVPPAEDEALALQDEWVSIVGPEDGSVPGTEIEEVLGGESEGGLLEPASLDTVAVERSVELLEDGSVLMELVPQTDYLADPETTYPVVIDPELEFAATFDTYVRAGTTMDTSTSADLLLGAWDGTTRHRVLMNFAIGPVHGKQILEARLYLYEYHSYSCQPRAWHVWDTTLASSATRWTNQPQWLGHYGTSSQTKGWGSACPEGDVWANITTLARRWANAPTVPTVGVGLQAQDEYDPYSWKRFYSADAGVPPVVWMRYNEVPPKPTSLGFQPTGAVHGGVRYLPITTPRRLTATVSDPENSKLTALFEVYQGGTLVASGWANAVPSGSSAVWTIGSGVLVEGKTYTFRVAAKDEHGAQGPWATSGSFAVDTSAPGAPRIASTTYPSDGTWNGGAGVAGTFTLTPVTADGTLVSYRWGLDKDPDTTVTASSTSGPTSLSITPPTNGVHVLHVQAVDRAGNTSPVVSYAFNVGRAGIIAPTDGARVVRRVQLSVTAQPQFTHVMFQWRRDRETPSAEIKNIDLAFLRGSDGTPVPGYYAPLPTGDAYTTWDAGSMLGRAAGPVQVRAVVATNSSGANQYVTPWVTVTVDPDASGAATTDLGPVSVNLLTGDARLSATDVEEFGLSVVRTVSSRETDLGYQVQHERLSTSQSEAAATTGVTAVNATVSTSTERYRSGGTSFKLVATGGGSDPNSYASVGGDTGGLRLGMKPGRTYRVSGWIYVPTATGLNATSPRGLRLAVFTRIGTEPYPDPVVAGTATERPQVTGAWQELSVDVRIPDGATEAFVRLYNGYTGASNKAVYFDDLSVREIWAPFGPQWSLGMADAAAGSAFVRITTPEENLAVVEVTGGGQIWFTSAGDGNWWPEPGAESLTLVRTSSTLWTLTDVGGTVTEFAKHGSSSDYPVRRTAPPAAEGQSRFVYETVDGVVRLYRIIAPVEAGVDGGPTNPSACTGAVPARGCEVLQFYYPSTTNTSTGVIAGQVARIMAWSTDPAVGGPTSMVEVAAYRYDASGRLIESWDPRLASVRTRYTYDSAGRLATMTPAGTLPWSFGYGPGGAKISGSGDLIDLSHGRLLTVSRASLQPGSATGQGPVNTSTLVYDVPLNRANGGPYNMWSDPIATWGQQDAPRDVTAVFGPEDPPGVTTATATTPGANGYAHATVYYLNASGWTVNVASPSVATTPIEGFIDTYEYDRFGNVIRTLDATNRLLALGEPLGASDKLALLGLDQLSSAQAALALDTRSAYSDDGVDLMATRGPAQLLAVAGDPNNLQVLHPVSRNRYDQNAPDGAAYHLLTTTNEGTLPLSADFRTAALLDNVVTVRQYHPIDGADPLQGTSGWVHKQPTRVTVDYGQPTATTAQVRYDARGRAIESRSVGANGSDARTTTTILYTAGANAADAGCGNRPEWAGSPCLTTVAGAVTGHDATRSATELPRKRVRAYNRWGSPTEVVESATGPVAGVTRSLVRSTLTTYDDADRVTSVSITGTGTGAGASIEKTRSVYDSTTGDVIRTETVNAAGQVTAAVTRTFDSLGRLYFYTDAHGGMTTTTYDQYGRVINETQTQLAGSGSTTIGSRDFVYDQNLDRRGFVTSIEDSVAGTIHATWGPDGQLEKQVLPGGVTLEIDYDTAQIPVRRTYTRDRDSALIWIDSVVINHRGQWIRHDSSTGRAEYTYDRLGRLVTTTDLLSSTKVCTTTGYTHDARSNRTAMSTVRGSNDGECMPVGAPGSTSVATVVDSADRVVSAGGNRWTHDPFGRVTTLPTASGDVVNEFFVNDLVAGQTVAGQARMTWALDPVQRRAVNVQQEWLGSSWVESATKVFHFSNDSDEPAWVVEDATLPSSVTRYVEGVEGALVLSTSSEGLVVHLVDLHGDVVGTIPIAGKDEEATWAGLELSRYDAFGAPIPLSGGATSNAPPRYGWLGAAQRSAETLGGVLLMGVRLYDPVSGRFLSPDPVPGGSATAYDYCHGDPVNCTDLGGTFSFKGLLSAVAVVGEIASLIPGPIGAAAAGVSAVAYAVQGNTAKALEMGVTAAAALVGAGPVVRVAARAASTAVKAGQTVARAAPRFARTAGQRLTAVFKRGCNSFTGGTLVLLADGSWVAIEDLVRGDLVHTTDPVTGQSSSRPVLATITGSGTKHLVAVTTTGTAFTATTGHPIWVEAEGWINAEDLQVGDQLTASDGVLHTVTEVIDLGQVSDQTVYNLTVSGTHTYYITGGGGTLDTLTHNANASCPRPERYVNSTGRSARSPNIETNLSASDHAARITSRGWVPDSPYPGPRVTFRHSSGARWEYRNFGNSHSGWTAAKFGPNGGPALVKLRLGAV